MKPTPDTKSFYQRARLCSVFAQEYLSLGEFGCARYFASMAREHWLKVIWEKQDESC